MRFSVIVPILLSAAAFILSILVLLAGRNPNFLSDTYIIKLNTTNIGAGSINIPNTGISFIDNAPDKLVSAVVQSTAKQLGIADFYTAHVMGYCESNLNATSDGRSVHEVTLNCTSKAMFTFNPVPILEGELAATGLGITLDDIGFPTEEVNNAVAALNVAYKVMFITYCLGIATAGACFLLGFVGLIVTGRLTACGNWIFAFVSFLSLGVASGIGTAIAVIMRDIINNQLSSVGVTARNSPKYLGMTWAAVGIMFIVCVYWCGACISGRKQKKDHHHHEKDQIMVDEAASGDERPVEKRRWRGFR